MEDKELQKEFIAYLAEESGAQNEQELEAYIKKIGKEGLQEAYQQFLKTKKKPKIAKYGAKLEFIARLNNECAADEEVVYYKVGGRFCKKCQKAEKEIRENYPKIKKSTTGTKVVQDFKNAMFAACGAKMKKKMKKQKGGPIETKTPTKTNKYPFTIYDQSGKKRTTYVRDMATADSLKANRFNDEETHVNRPGSFKMINGKSVWVPDRTKYPYNKPNIKK